MPFVHIVIVKFKADTTEAQIAGCFQALSDLLTNNLIPGLCDYSGGAYDSPEGLNKGFTHAFTMKFVDRESRDAYFPHPEHEKVKDLLVPLLEDVVCFDYSM